MHRLLPTMGFCTPAVRKARNKGRANKESQAKGNIWGTRRTSVSNNAHYSVAELGT